MSRARRGRGEGSVYQRKDGLWVASPPSSRDEHGKRIRRSLYADTKADAMEMLRRLNEQDRGAPHAPVTTETVAEYLKRWLASAAGHVRPSTHVRYGVCIKHQINPRIGGVRLKALEPAHVQRMLNALAADGTSTRLQEMAYLVLHGALAEAVAQRAITHNPCAAVKKPRTTKRPVEVWSVKDARKFLDATAGHRLHALFVVALSTCMRQGEMLGLHWADVDLKDGYIAVRWNLAELKGKLSLEELKTKKSRRRIDLDKATIVALKAHRKRMLAEGKRGNPLVFVDGDGGFLRKSNLQRRVYEPLIVEAGVPRIPFHNLRHTAATLLLLKGVHPKIVQERLGHATIAMTLDTYSHVLPSMQREAVRALDELWSAGL